MKKLQGYLNQNTKYFWKMLQKVLFAKSLPFCLDLNVSDVVNSLVPGRFDWDFKEVIFKLHLVTDGWGISNEVAIRWMSQDFTKDKSTLVQVLAWCHQATCHYLSQCWPRYLSPYGVTRPQWVKRWMSSYRWQSLTKNIFQVLNTCVPQQI